MITIKENITNESQIEIKDYPESVRIRKGMYVNNVEQMIYEIIDNAVDEHAAGRCDMIALMIKDGRVTIVDNGQGIPVRVKFPTMEDIKKNNANSILLGLTEAEIAYTYLHAGGKFSNDGAYKTSGGLHGVGAAVVNALSKDLVLVSKKNGKEYKAHFDRGIILENMTVVGDTKESGTIVSFSLDEDIWGEETFNLKKIDKRLKQLAYLNPGLKIAISIDSEDHNGSRYEKQCIYTFEDGIKDYVKELSSRRTCISDVIELNTQIGDTIIHSAFVYTDSYTEDIYSFGNNISTEDGGDHLVGFRQAINKAISSYIELHNVKLNNFKPDDTREGIVGVISVKVPNPEFEGQGKGKLKAPDLRMNVRDSIEEEFLDYLDKNPDDAKIIIEKIESAKKAREAAKRARENVRKAKKLIEGGDPEGLANCSSKKPEECEIYLVEGRMLSCPDMSFPVIAGV